MDYWDIHDLRRTLSTMSSMFSQNALVHAPKTSWLSYSLRLIFCHFAWFPACFLNYPLAGDLWLSAPSWVALHGKQCSFTWHKHDVKYLTDVHWPQWKSGWSSVQRPLTAKTDFEKLLGLSMQSSTCFADITIEAPRCYPTVSSNEILRFIYPHKAIYKGK